jgi:arylsulfatase A-like enzyme
VRDPVGGLRQQAEAGHASAAHTCPPGQWGRGHGELTERLLPQFMKDAGYATGWIGKWHLGASPAHTPWARGFTETFGFIGGGHRFLGWKPNERQYTLALTRNGQPVEVTNHLTTRFGEEAAAFVKRHRGEPWFLYLAFNAPHTPHEPTPERLEKFAAIQNPMRRKYAAQVSLMDDAIGAVMGSLAETKQAGRTLVFFFSDNGGPVKQGGANGSSNTPLRGGKGDVHEGGVHVPFVVSWPGKVPAGKDHHALVSSLDVFATSLALAGVPMPTDRKFDGVNLVPHLTGEKTSAPRELLFWRAGVGARHGIREGNWKLVRGRNQPAELYDLATDLAETKDLAAAKPDVLARLTAKLDAWDKELAPPAFLGSSVKNEDWGPGGANQRTNPNAAKKKAGPEK